MSTPKRKAEIIEKATELFYQRGFVGASIRDIVDAVGLDAEMVQKCVKYQEAQELRSEDPRLF
jgi:uncharacterized protein (DUF433 family)